MPNKRNKLKYNKRIRNIGNNKKLYNILLCLSFIFFSISTQNQSINKINKLISDTEIILTIIGTDRQQILNTEFNQLPSEILVNGNKINKTDYYVDDLKLEENNITIRFNETLTTCCKMFYRCSNIKIITFNMFDFSGTNTEGMFADCSNLISLDLRNFDSSSVTNMPSMFLGCSKLTSLDLSNFNISSAKEMGDMFNGCSNLLSLDLSYFNASSITNMGHMFYGCSKLTSLNLRNIKTSSVEYMDYMFYGCNNLISLDLSNFDTKLVKTMNSMFEGCNNLLSLELSHFNTSSVTNMGHMFYGCYKLISLDLRNIKTSSVEYMDYMFYGCNNLISLELSNFDTTSVKTMNNMFEGCSSLISLNLSNFEISSVENMNNMFEGCNDYLIYCIDINSKATQLLNHIHNSSFIFKYNNNCSDVCFVPYKKLILDTKKCIYNCTDNFAFEYNNICYSSCPNGTYNINNNICIENNNITYNNCIDYFYNIIKKNKNSNNYNNIIMNIQNELNNNILYKCIENIIIKENKDLLIKDNNIIYQLTSVYNQNHNIYNNLSSINFDECENKLRTYYNIGNNTTLLILKIDIFENGLLIPIIEYEAYNSKTKEQLNLNICQYIKINLNIPVNIDENSIFKYNSSNEYYNDICYSYTKNNSDFILEDRRDEYINNNLSLCEKGCEYNNYDYNNKKVLCECFTKTKIASLSEIEINKDKLLRNFIDIKNIININVLRCFKEVFNKEKLIFNLGFIIMGIIILITFILSILFKIKEYSDLKNRIYKIILNKKEINIKKEKTKTKIKDNPNKKRKINFVSENDTKSGKSSKIIMISKHLKEQYIDNNKKLDKNPKIYRIQKHLKTQIIDNNKTSLENSKNDRTRKHLITQIIDNKSKLGKNSKYEKKQKHLKKQLIENNQKRLNKINYNDYELNNLSYNEALKIDKRTYFQYYLSLLRTKHILIFSFYTYTDYNSKLIKIILFLFSFSLSFTINALFFNKATLHKIYEDQGKYNFIYQIPNILYSTIISYFILVLFNMFLWNL